jgi:hypothetical protein
VRRLEPAATVLVAKSAPDGYTLIFARWLRAEIAKSARVVKAANIKVE